MESITGATIEAFKLLIKFDADLWQIIWVSYSVSIRAILFAAPFAIVAAYLLAFHRFFLRQLFVLLLETWLALPAVVVGLTLYIMLSRSGPLGDWGLLFTQKAMVLGQIILAFPIIAAMAFAVFKGCDERIRETTITLGLPQWKAILITVRELRFGIMAAVVAGFGRIIAEVGCALMVGGNILNYTRNMTTAIALETSKGSFSGGIALGMVLLITALSLNYIVFKFGADRNHLL